MLNKYPLLFFERSVAILSYISQQRPKEGPHGSPPPPERVATRTVNRKHFQISCHKIKNAKYIHYKWASWFYLKFQVWSSSLNKMVPKKAGIERCVTRICWRGLGSIRWPEREVERGSLTASLSLSLSLSKCVLGSVHVCMWVCESSCAG